MDKELLNTMREECKLAFTHTLAGLSNVTMCRSLGRIQFQSSSRTLFNATIRVPSHSNTSILSVCDGIYTQLYQLISSHGESLIEAIYPSGSGLDVDHLNVLDTIYDLAINFVLQHEMNHILCGHVDYLREAKGLRSVEFSMSESLEERGNKSEKNWLHDYFLEVEADGTALEWMLDRLTFTQLHNEFRALLGDDSPENTPIADLPGACREVGFRYLLVAVWLVVVLMEESRSQEAKDNNARHPLPAARLITAMATFMMYYAKLENLEVESSGQLTTTLSGQDADSLKAFFSYVVKPVVRGVLMSNNANLVLPYDGIDHEQDMASFLKDVHGLLKGEDTGSAVMIQVANIEKVRLDVLKFIEPFRYMEGMIRDE
ncbi:hypothetical protein ACFL2V_02315 [Pseudomonadota bacterium]